MHRQTKQMESLFAHLGILLILFHSSFPSSSFHSSSLCNSCLVLPAELQSSWISWEIKTIQYIIILYYYKYCVCAQLCPTLCNPMDCSPPGSFVHGILQARILEWVAISCSRGSSPLRDRTRVSCIVGRRFTIWATYCNLAVPMTNINTSGVYHSLRAFQTSV